MRRFRGGGKGSAYFDGVNGAALGGFLDHGGQLRVDLIPGGGYALLSHGKNRGAEIGAQAAANTVFVYMNFHTGSFHSDTSRGNDV